MTKNLDELWEAASRTAAIEFLRRAITPDSTLASLKAALEFEGAIAHLETVKLRDVILTPAASKQVPVAEAISGEVVNSRKRSKSKGRSKGDAMKRLVLHLLDEMQNGVASGQVGQCLKDGGYQTSPMHTYTLLKAMQNAGLVTGEGDHRKIWQITTEGRKKLTSK